MSGDPSATNREWWNQESRPYQERHGELLDQAPAAWGTWRVPESELGVLGRLDGRDVLELGCGAAQWSIVVSEQGARAVGLDVSEAQLAAARRLVARSGQGVALVQASGERMPFSDGSFDVVFCDFGAMSFCRPDRTVPEAARLLRGGGLFAFCMSTPWRDVCWDEEAESVGDRLATDYFSLHRLDEDGSLAYQLPYGEWVRLFRRHRLRIEDLIEIRPPANAGTTYSDYVPLEWARRWPAEHVWKLVKES